MFLIKSVGIDLGSVHGACSYMQTRAETWQTELVDTQPFNVPDGIKAGSLFFSQKVVVDGVCEFVTKYRPHIIGLEDYTFQSSGRPFKKGLGADLGQGGATGAYVSFSMGNIGGMLRMRLWELGAPVVLISPAVIKSWVNNWPVPAKLVKSSQIKAHTRKYFDALILKPGQDIQGNSKQKEDMVDASMFAMISALIYSKYTLEKLPVPAMFWSHGAYEAIVRRAADPGKFFIRNIDRERQFIAGEPLG